jgi:hypothetical protein
VVGTLVFIHNTYIFQTDFSAFSVLDFQNVRVKILLFLFRKVDMDMSSPEREKLRDEENPSSTTSTEKEEGGTASNVVGWERDDPENPRDWSLGFKVWITFQLGMLALSGSLGSSIIAPAEEVIAEYVGVSSEVTVLMISLYM